MTSKLVTHAWARKRLRLLLEKTKYDSGHCNECPVCHKLILPEDDGWEYVQTTRGSEIFIHTDCVGK